MIKGNGAAPKTLNQYNYCLNIPFAYRDNNGKKPEKTYKLEPTAEINGIGLMWDETGTEGTIILGMDATTDDAYAIIVLDHMRDSGCSKNEINQFINKYREKKENDTLITAGKTIDYYEKFEDITEKLTIQMIKNEYENRDDYPFITWIYRLDEFKVNVQNKGPWDLKQLPEWNNSSLYIFDGKIVDKDAPGNIMYGYMGSVYGIPDIILYLGASYAQLKAGTSKIDWLFPFPGTWGDDTIDQLNIERGIEFYYKMHNNIAYKGEDRCCE